MKNFFKYFKSSKTTAIIAPIFKLLEVCFELCVPIIVAKIIDKITSGTDNVNYVIYACLILIVIGLLGFACALAAQYFSAKSAVSYTKNLRHDLFCKIESLSYSQIDTLNTDKLIVRMTNDTSQIQTGINLALRLLLRSPFVVFGAMIMAFVLNAFMGAVFAITITILSTIIFTILILCIKKYKSIQSGLENVTASTRENLKGVRVLRAFCKEREEVDEFQNESEKLYKKQNALSILSELLNPLTFAIINVAIIVILQLGAFKFNEGVMSVGTIVALYNYMAQILVELIKFANLMITISRTIASYKRVNQILQIDTDVKIENCDIVNDFSDAFIEFKNVSMNYTGKQQDSLKNISFTVKKGEIVGIVGATGAGKSSLVNLIPKFYKQKAGDIFIKGKNIDNISQAELSKVCGVVQQKVALFSGTIKDNILFGAEGVSEKELSVAINASQSSSVIESKYNGLNEMVEEGGKNFSLGQKQRLTIARALVRKPEILILDDATSALDNITQNNIINEIKSLNFKPTTFFVTQRVSSIISANKIIVLDEGKVVGIGTHKQLLKICPLYKELYNIQMGGVK